MKYILPMLMVSLLITCSPEEGFAQSLDVAKLKSIRLKQYVAGGLEWKGKSTQNTNWNKICETPDGRIWFCGGDHWGADAITGAWSKSDRYERPWGFGNTAISYYDPIQDKASVEFELDRVSSLYSNAESPGHGKTHSNLAADSKGNLYVGGYMGSSYMHEYTRAYFPKSYVGGAIVRYNPESKRTDYFGIPCPYGAIVALYFDEKRNIVNGLSVDRAKFWRVNLTTMELNIYESLARMSRLTDRVREMIMDRNGYCYFANDVGGLTKFDPDDQTFTDLDMKLPGKLLDFRASVVSKDNTIYAISTDGFVWSLDPKTGKLKDYGHVIGRPNQPHYTPNIALDEKWGRLYFLAGNHGGGVLDKALETLTVLDLKTGKFHWIGTVEGVEGCFGALVGRDHTVYFSAFGSVFDADTVRTRGTRRQVTRPYLLRYDPPEQLESIR